MVTDARTTNRSYKKPATGNTVAEDFSRLIDAMDAIDTDVAGLLTSVSQRALLSHTHAIANVTGLQPALDSKAAAEHTHTLNELSDVNVAGAANGQFLRLINGVWSPSSPAVLVQNIDGSTETGRAVLSGSPAQGRTALEIDAVVRRATLRNRIINGAFQISQERGTAHVDVTTGGAYVVDQWYAALTTSPGGTLRCQQVASPTPGGSPNRLRATVQVADTSIAAGDFYGLGQLIEGQVIADARFGSGSARHLVLRFGVNVSSAGTYGFHIGNADGSRSWIGTFTVASGDVNTDLLFSFATPGDTAGTWLNNTDTGMQITITLAAGSTFHGSPGWQAGSLTTTSAQANFMGATGRTFELFDFGLYVDHAGTGIAPPWEPPAFDDELRRCQRYWVSVSNAILDSCATAGSVGHVQLFEFPVPMRAVPALSITPGISSNLSSGPSVNSGGTSASGARFEIISAAAGRYFSVFSYAASARF